MNRPTASSWRGRAFAGVAAAALAAAGLAFAAAPANAMDNAVVGSGSNIIGIEYEDANFNGAQILVFSPNVGCTGSLLDVDFQIGGMPNAWSDEVSSYRGFGGAPLTQCWVKHYADANFGGATIGYDAGESYVGDSFNDTATSIRWS